MDNLGKIGRSFMDNWGKLGSSLIFYRSDPLKMNAETYTRAGHRVPKRVIIIIIIIIWTLFRAN
jgi:hypothetical protein